MQNNYLTNYSLTHTNPYVLFIQPYVEAGNNFREGNTLVGIGLSIPIVNTIVLLALRFFCTRPDPVYNFDRVHPKTFYNFVIIKVENLSEIAKQLKTDPNSCPNLHTAFLRLQKSKKNALPENQEDFAKKKRQIMNLAARLKSQPVYHSYLNNLIAYANLEHSNGIPNYLYKTPHPEGIRLGDVAEDLELLIPHLNATADSTSELRVFDTAFAPIEGQVEGA